MVGALVGVGSHSPYGGNIVVYYYIGSFTKELWGSHGFKTRLGLYSPATFHARIYYYFLFFSKIKKNLKLIFFFFLVGSGQAKSSQVPDMFPKRVTNSTSLLSHMLWQMLSSFHIQPIGGAKGKEL